MNVESNKAGYGVESELLGLPPDVANTSIDQTAGPEAFDFLKKWKERRADWGWVHTREKFRPHRVKAQTGPPERFLLSKTSESGLKIYEPDAWHFASVDEEGQPLWTELRLDPRKLPELLENVPGVHPQLPFHQSFQNAFPDTLLTEREFIDSSRRYHDPRYSYDAPKSEFETLENTWQGPSELWKGGWKGLTDPYWGKGESEWSKDNPKKVRLPE
tara:strand:- start:766 stop:1413 length:648 start_codon:yes stop_codon:yes gene_type:complete